MTASVPSDPPAEPPTSKLVGRAREGDPGGFAGLYDRLAPAVHAWAALRVPGSMRARLLPEDIVQEVFCRALERFSTFDPVRGGFRAWVFGIANFVLAEALRRLNARSPAQPGECLKDTVPPLDRIPDEATAISHRAARDEGLERFLGGLARLKDDERKLLIWCGLEGLTQAEAAGLLGVSPEAAAKRWQRLRRRLEDEGLPADLLAE